MNGIDPEFLSFLQSEESRSFNGALLEEVDAAIRSYNGSEYGDEEEGRSQVVARDVAETADYMLTSVVEAFVASGRVVEFEPTCEADAQLADDATEALHYIYRRKSGFRFVHDWAKAGLLEKIGVAKTSVEIKKKRVDQLYHPADLPQHAIEAEETDQAHPVDGAPMIRAVTLEDMPAQFPDYHIPLEEFRVAPDAIDLDSAVYIAHITEKSLSDLTQMGFEVDGISLSEGNNPFFTALSTSRDDGRPNWIGIANRNGVNRKVWLNEEYVLYDMNGDGIAERLCVHRVGNTILNIDEVEFQPFEFWCPYPMQGRLIGQSLADKVLDIQRVNTVLERSMLDSLYAQLRPGTFIHEDSCGDHTVDDLLTIAPNRIVRYIGGQPPIPETRNDVSGVAIQAIEFKTRQRESRTGITRLNKGVDEDTLNETAKGQAQLMSRGQQMERYVIRQFAEGVARLFSRKMKLLRMYAQPFQIRVDGQYRQVDPSQWPEDMEVNIKVGLGSGSKEDTIMGLQTVGQVQSMLKMSGSQIVTDDNVYNGCVALARAFNLQPNDLFTEPQKDQNGNPIPQQPPPDPKAQALQAQLQLKQQEIQQKQQEGEQKLQLMAAQHATTAQLQAANDQMQAEIAIRQQNLQAWLDKQQMALDQQKHSDQLDNQVKIAKLRPGGKLDA